MLLVLQIIDSEIKEIPENAFNYEEGVNERLKEIDIIPYPPSKGMIITLRRNAFSQLKGKYFRKITSFQKHL